MKSIYPQDLIIYKLTNICNLKCEYCYVFKKSDYKQYPQFTNLKVSRQLGIRILEHCNYTNKKSISLLLHGGEPLLIGKKKFIEIVSDIRQTCADIELNIYIQTNGILLDYEWLQILNSFQISFSISLDGPPSINNKFRKNENNSFYSDSFIKKILKLKYGIESREIFQKLFQGILCVIHPKTNPVKLYEWFIKCGFNNVNFLLPDGNYIDNPLVNYGEEYLITFLKQTFKFYIDRDDISMNNSFFKHVIRSNLGIISDVDAYGADLKSMCVVETDGSVSAHDVLRICKNEFSKDYTNVFDNQLGAHPDFYNLDEIQKLSKSCRECSYLISCGGGYLPHRFDGVTFNNKSIYCEVFKEFFKYSEEVLQSIIPNNLWKLYSDEEILKKYQMQSTLL